MAKKSSKILSAVPTLVLLALAVAVWLPRLLGYTAYYVSSGSMEPAIKKGSMAYVTPVALNEIKAGDDVLVFVDAVSQKSFMHRAVAVNLKAELIYTKGDANDVADPLPTAYSSCVGRVEYHIPLLGYAAGALNTLAGKIVVVMFYVIWLAFAIEKLRAKKEVEA